jgi:hypothetical protein
MFHYHKIFGSLWPRPKEKANFKTFTFFFNTGKIIPSRSRPSFEALFLGLENSHSVMGDAWSHWWTFFIQNHSSQDFGCKILVAHDAQGCFPILPSL